MSVLDYSGWRIYRNDRSSRNRMTRWGPILSLSLSTLALCSGLHLPCCLLNELILSTPRILLSNLFNMCIPCGRNTVALYVCVSYLLLISYTCELCHLVFELLPVGKRLSRSIWSDCLVALETPVRSPQSWHVPRATLHFLSSSCCFTSQ